ncbi:MAG: hypothetical protein QOE70_2037 [Chthoniobacter sp.]|jgi:uncharacterized membrane protein YkvA (DUF1232 family)|nr:hypothetical protein [Chthoniobacter sp.]
MKKTHSTLLNSAEFPAFVARGAAKITPATLHRLHAVLPDLREKFPEVHAPGFPNAPAQFEFLAKVIEAFASDRYRDLTYAAAGEAAFALLYLARDIDLIPDGVEEIGYLDDAMVAATVLQLHAAEFGKFARRQGLDWSQIAATE